RVAVGMRRERGSGSFRIRRLDAEEHQLRATRAARLLGCAHGDALVERLALQAQPVLSHRLDVLRAGDQRHVVAGAREHAAVVAANRSGAHDGDFHDLSNRPKPAIGSLTPATRSAFHIIAAAADTTGLPRSRSILPSVAMVGM